MDFFNFLFKKHPLILIPALLVFYLIRTAPVDLSHDKEIYNLMEQELKTRYLKQKLSANLSEIDKQQIENEEIIITKIKGKYSAASFITRTLYLKITFHTNSASTLQTLNYKICYDLVAKRWYIKLREIIELSWKVAI